MNLSLQRILKPMGVWCILIINIWILLLLLGNRCREHAFLFFFNIVQTWEICFHCLNYFCILTCWMLVLLSLLKGILVLRCVQATHIVFIVNSLIHSLIFITLFLPKIVWWWLWKVIIRKFWSVTFLLRVVILFILALRIHNLFWILVLICQLPSLVNFAVIQLVVSLDFNVRGTQFLRVWLGEHSIKNVPWRFILWQPELLPFLWLIFLHINSKFKFQVFNNTLF